MKYGDRAVESTGYNAAPWHFSDLRATLGQIMAESAVDASDP